MGYGAPTDENRKEENSFYPLLFLLLVTCGYTFHLPYRQTEGIIKATGKNLPKPTKLWPHL